MARPQIGLGLAGVAQQREAEAMRMLGQAAEMEARREEENRARRSAAEAGNVSLGTTVGGAAGYAIGAQIGSVGGPWGTVAGAVLGGLAGKYLF